MQSQTHASCPHCGESFEIAAIAGHPELAPVGMKHEKDSNRHFFHFSHDRAGCGRTFEIPADAFLPFLEEKIPELVLIGTSMCEGHCEKLQDLRVCRQPCHYAPFRRHLLKLRTLHARSTAKK